MMKKLLLFILLIFINASDINSQTLEEIATIELSNTTHLKKLLTKLEIQNIEFRVNKKSIGKFNCYYVDDIIEESIKEISYEQRKNLILIIENNSGKKTVTTFYDFDTKLIISLPLYIYDMDKGTIGDTVRVYDVEGKRGVVNLEEIGKEFRSTILRRIYLNIESLSKADRKQLFKNKSIIIPQDKAIERWINDVVRIRIFMIKN